VKHPFRFSLPTVPNSTVQQMCWPYPAPWGAVLLLLLPTVPTTCAPLLSCRLPTFFRARRPQQGSVHQHQP
jgi:hypothetical protein